MVCVKVVCLEVVLYVDAINYAARSISFASEKKGENGISSESIAGVWMSEGVYRLMPNPLISRPNHIREVVCTVHPLIVDESSIGRSEMTWLHTTSVYSPYRSARTANKATPNVLMRV